MFLFSKRKKDADRRREAANRLDGRHLKYVCERVSEIEEIVGRESAFNIKGDELLIYSEESMRVLFRCRIDEAEASELLSLEGAVVTAPDLEADGRERTIIAYYKYYR